MLNTIISVADRVLTALITKGSVVQLAPNAKVTLFNGREIVGPANLIRTRYRHGKPMYRYATREEVQKDADMAVW